MDEINRIRPPGPSIAEVAEKQARGMQNMSYGGEALAARELTAKELLGRHIERAERDLRSLQALHAAIPDNFPHDANRGLKLLIPAS